MNQRRNFIKALPLALAVPFIPSSLGSRIPEETEFYASILCVAGCGCVMLNARKGQADNRVAATRCTNPECAGNGVWYKIPTVEIERLA